jgi:hypothetical protein
MLPLAGWEGDLLNRLASISFSFQGLALLEKSPCGCFRAVTT